MTLGARRSIHQGPETIKGLLALTCGGKFFAKQGAAKAERRLALKIHTGNRRTDQIGRRWRHISCAAALLSLGVKKYTAKAINRKNNAQHYQLGAIHHLVDEPFQHLYPSPLATVKAANTRTINEEIGADIEIPLVSPTGQEIIAPTNA